MKRRVAVLIECPQIRVCSGVHQHLCHLLVSFLGCEVEGSSTANTYYWRIGYLLNKDSDKASDNAVDPVDRGKLDRDQCLPPP